jgi:outer membrane receptor protein involved in Fe transport
MSLVILAVTGPAWVFPNHGTAQERPMESGRRLLDVRVVDARSGRPIPGARVRVKGLEAGAEGVFEGHTDSETLRVDVGPGANEVSARALGYAPGRIVARWDAPSVTLRLDPRPLSVPELRARGSADGSRRVRVLNRETQELGGDDLGDWIRGLPGFEVRGRGPGGRSVATVRGSRPEALEVTLDGVPITDPLTGSADLSLVPGSSIERVVAEAGAGAGWGGAAGVIRLQSRAPRPGVRAGLGVGSFGFLRTEADAGVATPAMDIGGFVRHEGATNDFAFVNRVGTGQPREHRVNADYDAWSGLVRAVLHDLPVRFVGRVDVVQRGVPGRMGSRLWENARWHERAASIGAAIGAGGAFDASAPPRLSLSWAGREQRYVDPRIPRQDSLRVDQLVLGGSEGLPWGLDVDWRATWSVAAGTALDGRPGRGTAGVRVDRWIVRSTRWRVDGSLGVDAASGFRSALSPSVSVEWVASQAIRVRARAGQGFRLPTFGDLFLRPGTGARPNTDLRPERVRLDTELGGLMALPDLGLEAGVTAFYRRTADPIVWLPSVLSVWSPMNAGRLAAYGVESELSWVPSPGWMAEMNATVQRSRVGFEGYSNPLPYQAHLSGRASLERRGPGPDARVDVEIQGPRRTSMFGPHELPAVALVGIRGRQDLTFAGFDAVLEVGVSNVLDAAYERVELFPEPGRTFEVRIDVGARSGESLP